MDHRESNGHATDERSRHLTLNGQGRYHNTLRGQYLGNGWR